MTIGRVRVISLQADMMPLAMVEQSTIPPNIFTRMACTCSHNKRVSSPIPDPNSSSHLFITGEKLEGIENLFFVDTAPYIQKVGWLSMVQFDDIHGSHGEACTIY
jgi:hypothetical protein